MSLERCFEDGKLRHVRQDLLKVKKSLEIAESKLMRAKELAQAEFWDVAIISAYAAMFHAGRALLFRDGVSEKSHYCLILYLEENYAKKGKIKGKFITLMDAFREERHGILYSLEDIDSGESEANEAVETAKKLLEAVKKLLG